ncbi:hypothetical protein Micbo1qcDRAFT_174677 [Microdochium bolleyi]|uniref:Uncharacterized protein n=1 Tax=Microdochium bolleyi TaxID=196109 RepID=A0A136J3G0_9PEZI|nr:hypothetical protein Micbo1qcDRAFT_174677 [Microdochium bolleyi]
MQDLAAPQPDAFWAPAALAVANGDSGEPARTAAVPRKYAHGDLMRGSRPWAGLLLRARSSRDSGRSARGTAKDQILDFLLCPPESIADEDLCAMDIKDKAHCRKRDLGPGGSRPVELHRGVFFGSLLTKGPSDMPSRVFGEPPRYRCLECIIRCELWLQLGHGWRAWSRAVPGLEASATTAAESLTERSGQDGRPSGWIRRPLNKARADVGWSKVAGFVKLGVSG